MLAVTSLMVRRLSPEEMAGLPPPSYLEAMASESGFTQGVLEFQRKKLRQSVREAYEARDSGRSLDVIEVAPLPSAPPLPEIPGYFYLTMIEEGDATHSGAVRGQRVGNNIADVVHRDAEEGYRGHREVRLTRNQRCRLACITCSWLPHVCAVLGGFLVSVSVCFFRCAN